ncbi:MAG: MoaD/ThiS family protein [Lachnospiraceae bacterium]|nr:MoaD/ThiS family protein [Lachnospiraceae bacterium]
MPRISDNVRFSARRSGSSEVEKYYVETGTTYRQVLEDELDVVPTKFTLYVNGAEVDLDDEVQDGDELRLEARKYSSGC